MEIQTQTYHTNYSVAVHWMNNNLVLCNSIVEVDPSVYDNARFDWNYVEEYENSDGNIEEYEYSIDIFQWFITDCSEWDVKYLEESFPGLLFSYSDLLDCYILCVQHFGTAWGYVDWKTTNPNAAAECGQTKEDILKRK